jgi:hypothetical protein
MRMYDLMRVHHSLHQITGEMSRSFGVDPVDSVKLAEWIHDLDMIVEKMREIEMTVKDATS